jgi:hypothetical protein
VPPADAGCLAGIALVMRGLRCGPAQRVSGAAVPLSYLVVRRRLGYGQGWRRQDAGGEGGGGASDGGSRDLGRHPHVVMDGVAH